MAGLLTTSSQLLCPHGGTVTIITTNTRSRAAGSPVVRSGDTFTVAGCSFAPVGTPHPCVRVQWIQPAVQNQHSGDHALTQQSTGMCLAADQAPQGTVQIVTVQTEVAGR